MTVYVDDMFMSKQLPGMRPAIWCHMTADTKEELHAFARSIGLRRSWFQDKPRGRWHYDVTKTVRAKAVKAGAAEVSVFELARVICKKVGREGLVAENGDALAVFDPSCAPGGMVCSACGTPIESVPCQEHQPRAWEAID